jgi:hypothetical protein
MDSFTFFLLYSLIEFEIVLTVLQILTQGFKNTVCSRRQTISAFNREQIILGIAQIHDLLVYVCKVATTELLML